MGKNAGECHSYLNSHPIPFLASSLVIIQYPLASPWDASPENANNDIYSTFSVVVYSKESCSDFLSLRSENYTLSTRV